MVIAQYNPSAGIAGQRAVVVDGKWRSGNPVSISKFMDGDGIFAEHQHPPWIAFENGGVADGLGLCHQLGGVVRGMRNILRAASQLWPRRPSDSYACGLAN